MARKILAIDYGRVRIGTAISYGNLAEPLSILQNSPTIFTELKQIIDQEHVEQILFGLSDQQMAQETIQFAEQFKQHIALPIDFFDESYSSKTVQRKLIESGSKQSKRRQPIDHFAAAEFLQEYLDSNRP